MKRYRFKSLHEDDVIDTIEDDIIDDIDVVLIEDQLEQIGDNLGYPFTSSNGRGSFSISDNVEIDVRFTPTQITSIETNIIKRPSRFNCTKNTTTVDNLSVELQTCVMIIKDIRSKLKVR